MMAWLGMLCRIGKDACSSYGDGADGQGSEHHGALLDNFGWEAISAVTPARSVPIDSPRQRRRIA